MQAQGYRRRRFQEVLLFCMVPWILTPACKANFFKVEAMMQMQRQVHASSINVRPSSSSVTPRSIYSSLLKHLTCRQDTSVRMGHGAQASCKLL